MTEPALMTQFVSGNNLLEKLTFLAPDQHKYVCVSGVNVSFSENFAEVLNKWSLRFYM